MSILTLGAMSDFAYVQGKNPDVKLYGFLSAASSALQLVDSTRCVPGTDAALGGEAVLSTAVRHAFRTFKTTRRRK